MGRQMVGAVTSGSCRTINKVVVNTRDTCMQVMQNCKAESKIRFDNYKGGSKRLIMLIMEQIISILCFWHISLYNITLTILASAHEPMMSFVRN